MKYLWIEIFDCEGLKFSMLDTELSIIMKARRSNYGQL